MDFFRTLLVFLDFCLKVFLQRRKLGQKYKVNNKNIKNYLEDMKIIRRAKKSTSFSTERQQKVTNPEWSSWPKLFFSTIKCVFNDEFNCDISHLNVTKGNNIRTECEMKEASDKEKKVHQKTKREGNKRVRIFQESLTAISYHKHDNSVLWSDLAYVHYDNNN